MVSRENWLGQEAPGGLRALESPLQDLWNLHGRLVSGSSHQAIKHYNEKRYSNRANYQPWRTTRYQPWRATTWEHECWTWKVNWFALIFKAKLPFTGKILQLVSESQTEKAERACERKQLKELQVKQQVKELQKKDGLRHCWILQICLLLFRSEEFGSTWPWWPSSWPSSWTGSQIPMKRDWRGPGGWCFLKFGVK